VIEPDDHDDGVRDQITHHRQQADQECDGDSGFDQRQVHAEEAQSDQQEQRGQRGVHREMRTCANTNATEGIARRAIRSAKARASGRLKLCGRTSVRERSRHHQTDENVRDRSAEVFTAVCRPRACDSSQRTAASRNSSALSGSSPSPTRAEWRGPG